MLTVQAATVGAVVAWGENINGYSDVPRGLSGVAAIAAGSAHTLALKSDCSVVTAKRQKMQIPSIDYISFPLGAFAASREIGWASIKTNNKDHDDETLP